MVDGPISSMLELDFGWEFATGSTIGLLRDTGFAYRSNSTIVAEYAGFVQAGTLATDADVPYYLLGSDTVPVDFGVANEFNEAIQVYGDASHGNFDKRSAAYFYSREASKTYGYYDLAAEQSLSALTYRSYLVPMTTATDSAISVPAPTGSPYTGMTLTVSVATNTINSIVYNFAEGEIEANSGTVQQVYDWYQDKLLSSADIDAGAATQRGDTYGGATLSFAGGVLTTSQGLTIKNIATADVSNVIHTDDLGIGRQEAFVPSFTLNCVDSNGSSTNFTTGTRVRIYDTTNASQLYNALPGTVSTISISHTAGGSAILQYKIIATNGTTNAEKMIKATSTVNADNVAVNVVQLPNTIYVNNLIDGTTLDTDITIDAGKIDINVSDSDDTISLQGIYNWTQTYLTTEAGIADSDDLVAAQTQTKYIFDDTVEVANTKTNSTLVITGGTATDVSGSVTGWLDITQNNIVVAPAAVEGFEYASVSNNVITTITPQTLLGVTVT
jgi:hypothetical protein